jgi:hypothetical protein
MRISKHRESEATFVDKDAGKSPFGPHGGGGASCAFAIPLNPIVNKTAKKTFFILLPF